jgi:hypothetical protein
MGAPKQPRKKTRRSKTGRWAPLRGKALKRRWEDPEYRAKQTERLRSYAAARKGRAPGHWDGMTLAEATALNAAARERAELIVTKMKEKGVVDENIHPDAEKALKCAVEIVEGGANTQTKLAAARLVLDFRMSKPTSKSEVTVNAAEKWLAEIANDEATEAAGDTKATA